MSPIQQEIDNLLRASQLQTVIDCIYFPLDQVILVIRKLGRKNVSLDISGAKDLRDLYDCRICANHIAQAYMRGIMNAKDLKRDGGFLWFDLNGTDDDAEVMAQLSRLSSIADSSLI